MNIQRGFIISAALLLSALPGSAAIVYVVNNQQQFGTVNLATGAFQAIGPGTPEGNEGLVPGPGGSLLTLTDSGNLDSINPVTGLVTSVTATGLGNCTDPVPPQCGPNSASTIGALNGTIYATDLANNLYKIDPATDQAKLIGATGIPAIPFLDGSQNADGSINVADADLFASGGQLYEYFEAQAINPFGALPVVVNQVVVPKLYRINTTTGAATLVTATAATLTSIVNVSGTIYGFDGSLGEIVTVNLTNGAISPVSTTDPNAAIIGGATAAPEPGSLALIALGVAAFGVRRRFKSAAAILPRLFGARLE